MSRFWWAMLGLLLAGQSGAEPEVRPSLPVVLVQEEKPVPIAFLVLNHSDHAAQWQVDLHCDRGQVEPARTQISVPAKGWQVVTATVRLDPQHDSAEVTAQVEQQTARIAVRRGIDLTQLRWRRLFVSWAEDLQHSFAAVDWDDSNWETLTLPSLWTDLRRAWCRVRVHIPSSWQGKRLRLYIAAVDDNDVTYFNGVQVGSTRGWDVARDYDLPSPLIRFGADNVIAVMVENTYAGGGLYKAPLFLLVGDEPISFVETVSRQFERPKPSIVAPPKPLRPMVVRDGVLYYADGGEVALWGVNYYPQSWFQFVNMKRLGVDMKATIRQDLDHLQQMGVEIIRIHVFDREITDSEGNIIDNEHIDLLDYLVAECSRRQIYLMFTPIAWWGGPGERADSFSANTSKPGMMFVPEAKRAAANYLSQFLNRVNRYTGRAYKHEPSLVLLEVMNEPAYFGYQDLFAGSYTPQGERAEVIERDRVLFRQLWQDWCIQRGLEQSAVYFPLFRYELMRQYIRQMIEAIRSTGARQPIAIAFFGGAEQDITQAIADSECEAITVPATYPGGWEQVNDGVNFLPQMAPMELPAVLSRKARLQYEFDAPATNVSCYLFPAMAAHFRSGEVQVACQFQYDSISTARWNSDWQAHWLNWIYTPSKAVSFMIGGEVFRLTPRGLRYPRPGTEFVLPGLMATSFTHNQSMLVTSELVLYARGIGDWQPLFLPNNPRQIVGVGSSPYVTYTGSGIYRLWQEDDRTLRLQVNPNVTLVGNSLRGSLNTPVAEISEQPHLFRLHRDGWQGARCFRVGSRVPLPKVSGGWLLTPGEYVIRK